MTKRAALCLVVVAIAALAAGCGGGDDDKAPTAKPKDGPTFVENDSCRSAATSMLDDADSGAASTDPDEIQRYLGAVQSVAAGLDCSPNVASATESVVSWLTGYQRAWVECELRGQFLDLNGDGESDGTGACSDADRPFAEVKDEIADARALVELKE